MTAAVRSVPFDFVAAARRVLLAEADAVRAAADRVGPGIAAAAEIVLNSRGRVVVTGVGKSADVGQKIVGTLNSTGTRAYALDATRAMHGDLGMVAPDDVAVLLSHSGESEELLRLLGPLKQFAAKLIAITSTATNTLAKAVDAAVVYGPLTEACPNKLAPSASTAVMMAVGDAVAFAVSEARQFGPADFARVHPAGSLGRKLATVAQHMRTGHELRLAPATATVREVFTAARHARRRTGAILLTHPDGTLAGLFTDSDLAKLFETRHDAAFDGPVSAVMTRNPLTVAPTAKLTEAIELLKDRKFSELPVLDTVGVPVGMLDITDVIGWEPPANAASPRPPLRLLPRGAG